jgi:hypothetical protein
MLLGLGLALLGVALYVVQISLERLMAPWYLPAFALLGVILVGRSLWKRRTIWRILALAAVVLLAGGEIAMLVALRLPAYTGSIAAGKTFPAFQTKRADGTAFTQRDLVGEQASAMVFFRGRW